MPSGIARKSGKKNRKHGRNKDFCQGYARSHQQEKNQIRSLRRHLKKHPEDGIAAGRLANLAVYS
jgi:hypothetical protein